MTASVRNVTFDCADPWALSAFWQEATGYPRHPDDVPGDDGAALVAPDGAGPALLFLRVPEGKSAKNRLHLDLQPDTGRDQETDRLIVLGARMVDDRRLPDGQGWVVLADPEGNEFCVVRSAAERAATTPPAPQRVAAPEASQQQVGLEDPATEPPLG
ncbi:VOC family protein [Rugosimonospora acidiphila]|uniref:VOC family protein n=1 Tax=Rugosimonospora acidiphila TaxID=556531 RepID=A0ABP9RNH7_9ACTN